MQMHLFSSSDPMLENVIRVSKKLLRTLARPVVLYIPPQVKQEYVYLTKQAFQDLAEVQVIDLRSIEQHQFQQALQDTSLIFVPGGNTFYLNFQLHQKGLIRSLRQIVHDGVPYIGVSAGTLITGEKILQVTISMPADVPFLLAFKWFYITFSPIFLRTIAQIEKAKLIVSPLIMNFMGIQFWHWKMGPIFG